MRIVTRTQHEDRTVLAISTGLSAYSAAKSRLQRGKKEPGHLITPKGEILPWIPEGTFSRNENANATTQRKDTGILHIWGPDFQGTSLLDIITSANTQAAWLAFHRCFSTIIRAASDSGTRGDSLLTDLAQSGPEAIIQAQDGSVLILPGETYRRCIVAQGTTVERENRLEWVLPDHSHESPERGVAFLAGACAYRILTGVSPFMNSTFWSVQAKAKEAEETFLARLIRYEYAVPLNFLQPKLKSSLCERIMEAIMVSKPASAMSILDFGESHAALIEEPSSKKSPQPSFIHKKTTFEQKYKRKLTKSVFLQKNATKFLITGIIGTFVIIFGGIFISDMASKPSTEGLEPQDVVNGFYNAVDQLDSNTLQAYASNNAFDTYSGLLTSMYMTNRIRENFEGESKMASPLELFEKKLDNTNVIYGITNFTSKEIQRNDATVEFSIGFYLFIPENLAEQNELPDASLWTNEEPLSVYYYHDTCTLLFKKDRWIVENIQPTQRSVIEKSSDYIFETISQGRGATLPYAPQTNN